MKNRILLPLALVFASNAATAATTADLTVTGKILPTSCNISLVGGDYVIPDVDASDLSSTTTTLSPITKQMSITCSGPARVAIRTTDNQDGTETYSSNSNSFGLGLDGQGGKIGHYTASLGNILIDGSAGHPSASDDSGTTWTRTLPNSIYASPNYWNSWNITGPNNPPVAGQNITADLTVQPYIAPRTTLDTSQEISIQGSATIELVYL